MALPTAPSVSKSPGVVLSERLRELGLTRAFLRSMTKRGDDLRSPLTPTREALLLDEAPHVALRLLFCGQKVGCQQAQAAFGAQLSEQLTDAGLLLSDNGEVLSPFHLRLVRGLYLFSDYLGDEPDAVMGAGETTGLLYQAADWDRPTKRVLDLGCGAGTIALLLSRKAENVLGTDVNHRAVALADWNASVNGITNAEFRAGSLYESVRGEQFDIIVSQPPYYPAPENSELNLTYLHGGIRGDEIAWKVVAGVEQHLAENGRALVFTSWPSDTRRTLRNMRVLELAANRRELHGTRQSLNILQRVYAGKEQWTIFEVPADDWGNVSSSRIEQLLLSNILLQEDENLFLQRQLHLPPGTANFCEGDEIVLRYPPESLVGCIVISEQMWRMLTIVDKSSNRGDAVERGCELEDIRRALHRGWLTPVLVERATQVR